MSQPVRIGLIGCGGISRHHAQAVLSLGDEQVLIVATCDVDLSLARARAEQTGAEFVTTDWREVVEHSQVDAVDICLPHDLHAEVAIAAAEAGKHIFVEKPIATTLEDGWRMVHAARRADVRLMVAFVERFEAENQRTKQLLDEGWLGVPVLAQVDHLQDVFIPPGHWARDRERLGGGAIASAGCHRIDLLRWFIGEVEWVSAETYYNPERMQGEIAGVVNMQFTTGALATLSISWMSPYRAFYRKLWLEGTEGCVHNWNGLHIFSRRRPEWSEGFVRLDVEAIDPFAAEMRHFVECVREGKQPLTNGEDALRSQAVAIASYESERTGCRVRPAHLLSQALEGLE
ncbi:MAG: Gfo/Idh/MocA family oxidoreductase [Chthonomonadetes bacterium]|nr:Gfo/Idh/MocA family oxidoreductase [Chthonomonadetes bacterium]